MFGKKKGINFKTKGKLTVIRSGKNEFSLFAQVPKIGIIELKGKDVSAFKDAIGFSQLTTFDFNKSQIINGKPVGDHIIEIKIKPK